MEKATRDQATGSEADTLRKRGWNGMTEKCRCVGSTVIHVDRFSPPVNQQMRPRIKSHHLE